jgi:inhibitor of cysteine peptidase
MKKTVNMIEILVLITLFLTGFFPAAYAEQAKKMNDVILSAEENGKSVNVEAGSSLLIRLPESPTTGYVWVNKTAGDILLLQESDYAQATPGVIGGAGLRSMRYLVTKPGRATLLLKQMREWEGDSSTVAVFSVSIQAIQINAPVK